MRITLPSGTSAELAKPTGTPTRGLVVAPDIWGLRPLFDDLTARLAEEWNSVVVTVEPFPNRDLPMELEPRWAAVAEITDDERFNDFVEAGYATGVDSVGMIGFCLGGMYVNKCSSLAHFDSLASFYGMIRIPPAARCGGHHEPLDLIERNPEAAAKLLAVVGDLDPYTPPDDVAALAALGVTTARFAEAGHAFAHDASRESYRATDAEEAWRLAKVWLSSGRIPAP